MGNLSDRISDINNICGILAFLAASAAIAGTGFRKIRRYLRRKALGKTSVEVPPRSSPPAGHPINASDQRPLVKPADVVSFAFGAGGIFFGVVNLILTSLPVESNLVAPTSKSVATSALMVASIITGMWSLRQQDRRIEGLLEGEAREDDIEFQEEMTDRLDRIEAALRSILPSSPPSAPHDPQLEHHGDPARDGQAVAAGPD
jgi:hypothetical protein